MREGCGSLGGKAYVQDGSLAGRPDYVLSFLQSADIGGSRANVRFVPMADIGQVLFDHLVGAGKQSGRYGNSQRLSSLEVDDELKFGWLLHWQVGWLGTP